MGRKEKNAPISKVAAKQPQLKNQRVTIVLCMLIIIAAVFFTGIRNTVEGFYNSFVLHDSTVSAALANVDPLHYSDSEKSLLSPLQTRWDLYRDARLAEREKITADDGVTLSGIFYDEGSDITVIALHDFNNSAEGDFLYGPFYGETVNANLLLPDSRNHGESGGNYVSYGYWESEDLLQWVGWLTNHCERPQTIILHGDTMGAAAALMSSARLPENVALIVAESPYDSLEHAANYTFKEWFGLPSPFLTLLQWRSDAGYSLEDVVITDAVRTAKIPVIFLAGIQDSYIPESLSRMVYDAYGGEKEWVEVDADHGLVYATDQKKVEDAIKNRLSHHN